MHAQLAMQRIYFLSQGLPFSKLEKYACQHNLSVPTADCVSFESLQCVIDIGTSTMIIRMLLGFYPKKINERHLWSRVQVIDGPGN